MESPQVNTFYASPAVVITFGTLILRTSLMLIGYTLLVQPLMLTARLVEKDGQPELPIEKNTHFHNIPIWHKSTFPTFFSTCLGQMDDSYVLISA